MKALDEVYKKWQGRSSGPACGENYGGSSTNEPQVPGRDAWLKKFGGNLQAPIRQPSRHRPKKRKPKVRFLITRICYKLLYTHCS